MVKDILLPVGYRMNLCELMHDELGYENDLCFRLWKTERKNDMRITKAAYRIEKFEHFFMFDISKGKWHLKYTQDIPYASRHQIVTKWEQVVPYFREWARNLLVEIKAASQWESLSPIPLQVPFIEDAAMPIQPAQQKHIQNELQAMVQAILQGFQPTNEQKNYITMVFGELKVLLARFSRSAWVHTFIGIAFSVGLQLGVSYSNTDPFWQLCREIVNRIAGMFSR